VPRTLDEAFEFFSNPWNLEAITPGWLRFRIVEAPAVLELGARIRYRLRLFGVPIRWTAQIGEWHPPRSFTDVQLAGPYRVWEHTHRFTAVRGGTEIYDHVRYLVPGGPAGALVERFFVRGWLEQIFDFRAVRLGELLGR
jgi:ligand-binding SRPBCC domain-containing protein